MKWTATLLLARCFMAVSALCFIALPLFSQAQSQSTDIRPNAERLSSEQLLTALKGVTLDGSYNFDTLGVAGGHYVETHHADARVSYAEAGLEFSGVWTIRDNMVCYRYSDPGLTGGCFRVYQIKNCFYFYSNLLIETPHELDRDYWTARSVVQGQEPECAAGMS